MPIIKSAVKRMKQTVGRHSRNVGTKRSMRVELKAFAMAIEAKDAKKAAEALKKVQSKLDIAVKKNILKKNTAARKLSQLTAQAKALGAKPTASVKKATNKAPATKKASVKKPAKKPVDKKTTKK